MDAFCVSCRSWSKGSLKNKENELLCLFFKCLHLYVNSVCFFGGGEVLHRKKTTSSSVCQWCDKELQLAIFNIDSTRLVQQFQKIKFLNFMPTHGYFAGITQGSETRIFICR